jgi:hypothetical protein
MVNVKIDSHEVFYSSNTFYPRIGLLSQQQYVGQLLFLPNGAALPDDLLQDGQPQLHYHLADFHNVIDLLRNEGDVYLLYAGSGGGSENALHVYSKARIKLGLTATAPLKAAEKVTAVKAGLAKSKTVKSVATASKSRAGGKLRK